MTDFTFSIEPYDERYQEELMVLEKNSPQGKQIKLEMVRDHFLSRSVIFDDYEIFIAFEELQKKLVGVIAMAVTNLEADGKRYKCGVGYDLKIHPQFRKRGISKKLSAFMIHRFQHIKHVDNFFITMKKDNIGADKMASALNSNKGVLDFIYLTIPTSRQIEIKDEMQFDDPFHVTLFDQESTPGKYHQFTENRLGVWNTYKTYQLRIVSMPTVMQWAIPIVNIFKPTSRKIPSIGKTIKMATLFDVKKENISDINQVLRNLAKKDVDFLNVCCSSDGFIHQTLRKYAINKLPYCLQNSMDLNNGSMVNIDVRCL